MVANLEAAQPRGLRPPTWGGGIRGTDVPSDGAKGETGLHEDFGIGAVSNEGTPKSGTEGRGWR